MNPSLNISSTRLEDLPSDCWVWIQAWLHGFPIVRLTMCGSRRLSANLFNSITDLSFHWPSMTKTLGWPTTMRNFIKLKRFYYNSGRVTSNVEYFPTVEDLKLIPSSLEVLYLRCDGAEAAFRNGKVSLLEDETGEKDAYGRVARFFSIYEDSSKWLNLAKEWPNLRYLSLHQFTPFRAEKHYFGPLLPMLPRDLHTLKLRCSTSKGLDLSELPRNLKQLDMRVGEMNPELFHLLPLTLESLRCSLNNSSDLSQLEKLPRSLRRLILIGDRCGDSTAGKWLGLLPPLFYLSLDIGSPTPKHIIENLFMIPSLMHVLIGSTDIEGLELILTQIQLLPNLTLIEIPNINQLKIRIPNTNSFQNAVPTDLLKMRETVRDAIDVEQLIASYQLPV
jgi:hypothetical protein